MANLNLSHTAYDFIKSLAQKQAKPLWDKINRLLQGSRPGDIIELGQGKFCTETKDFFIVLHFDATTVYIDSIGKRDDPHPAAASGSGKPDGPPHKWLHSLKFDANFVDLLILSFATTFFALAVTSWFTLDLGLFAAMPIFPLITCLAGTAIGIWYRTDRPFRLMPICLLLTVLVGLYFKYIGLSPSGFLTQALSQCGSQSFSLDRLLWPLTIVISSAVLLIAPFSFAVCMGSRIGKIFTPSNALVAYGTTITAGLFSYLTFVISTGLSVAPAYQLAALALGLITRDKLTPRLPLKACLLLASIAVFIPFTKNNEAHSPIYFNQYVELALAAILITTVVWLGRTNILSKVNPLVNWQLFFLGAGLSCMVQGSLPRLVTLYGNNWYTYTTIFSGILLIAAWANHSMQRRGARQYELILYVGLFVSLTFSCFLPVRWLSSFGILGDLLITLFTVLPMFRVLFILPARYSGANQPVLLFGFTLIGLSTGLLVSYVAFYFGYNGLLLISLILLGCSFLLGLREQKAFITQVAKLATRRIT